MPPEVTSDSRALEPTNSSLPVANTVANTRTAAFAAGVASNHQRCPHEWGAVVVAASCRDPLRVLRSRDMEVLRNRAVEAACPLVPVLITCTKSPPGRRAAALRALADSCAVAPSEVRMLWLDAELLHRPAAMIPHTDLFSVWHGTVDCIGATELRQAVHQAVAPVAVQSERQLVPPTTAAAIHTAA